MSAVVERTHVSKFRVLSRRKGGFLSREEKRRGKHTLAAPGDELAAVLDELARHLEEFLGLVHCCWCVWCVWYVCCVGFVRVFGSFALLVWLLEGVGMASLVCGCVV